MTTGPDVFDPDGVEWSRVSPQLARLRRAVLLGTGGGLVVAAAALAVFVSPLFWLAEFVPLVGLAAGWGIIGRQVAAYGYAERADDLLVRRGVMFRNLVVVPYGRMQFVDVQAGPLERAFDVARVQLHTASAGTDALIPGLPPEEAARLRDRLASRGQARLAGL
ncbi:PH domain-containing protein [Spongisporangium articulatum]|uniref:PH domain-containing protein n=1 Tax=Spongisporangium articulatum TaxID=3362603 RepID=A0ABW8ANJ1_9ACTN